MCQSLRLPTALLALLALLVSVSPASAQTNPFEPAAIIDEQIVTRYDVLQRARQIAIELGGDPESHREAALEALISETLLRNAALAEGYAVNDDQVAERLQALAEAQGANAEDLVAFFESRGVDAFTVGRWLENQLLQEAYLLQQFRDRALNSVQPADVDRELLRYEREQYLELHVHQLDFGRPDENRRREVERMRSRVAQALADGAGIAEVGSGLAATDDRIAYRDLGWQPEQVFQDPRLISAMVSLPAGTIGPPITFGGGGVSMFYVQDRRVRTLPGVEPFRFDLVLLSTESPDTSDAAREALVGRMEAARESLPACDGDADLPEGISRQRDPGVTVAELAWGDRREILALEPGAWSGIVLSEPGGSGTIAWMLAVCQLTGGFLDEATRTESADRVREQLVNARLAELGSEHVRELRQRAEIDIR